MTISNEGGSAGWAVLVAGQPGASHHSHNSCRLSGSTGWLRGVFGPKAVAAVQSCTHVREAAIGSAAGRRFTLHFMHFILGLPFFWANPGSWVPQRLLPIVSSEIAAAFFDVGALGIGPGALTQIGKVRGWRGAWPGSRPAEHLALVCCRILVSSSRKPISYINLAKVRLSPRASPSLAIAIMCEVCFLTAL